MNDLPDDHPEGTAEKTRDPAREPIFNVPGVIVALIGVFVLVALYRSALGAYDDFAFVAERGFVPARLSLALGFATPQDLVAHLADSASLDAPDVAYLHFVNADGVDAWSSLITYAGIHGDWTHLTLNSLWFLAFGSVVARRLGTSLFLLFFVLGAAGAALAYAIIHPLTVVPVIGASGAVSAAMGAALLLPFRPFGDWQALEEMQRLPIMRFGEALTNRRVVTVTLVWFALNIALVFGFGAPPGEPATIAWEAHIAGYVLGVVLLYALDRFRPVPPRSGLSDFGDQSADEGSFRPD